MWELIDLILIKLLCLILWKVRIQILLFCLCLLSSSIAICVCACVQTSCLWDCCFACPLSSSSLSLSLLPLLCCSLNTDFSFPASIRKSRDVLVFMCSIRLTYPNNNFHYISFIIRSLRTQHMQCLYLHILISNISNRLSDHNFCNFTFDFLESWMRYFSNCSMA